MLWAAAFIPRPRSLVVRADGLPRRHAAAGRPRGSSCSVRRQALTLPHSSPPTRRAYAPRLMAARPEVANSCTGPLRLWCAGAATRENEPVSFAIFLQGFCRGARADGDYGAADQTLAPYVVNVDTRFHYALIQTARGD